MSKRVLFVCEGNICRSPMAEWLANHALRGQVEAESAGLKLTGRPATPHALPVLSERLGIDASAHASRNVGEIALDRFDVVVALHEYVAGRLRAEYGIAPDITWDVPDPIGSEIDGYRVTFEQIDRAIAGLLIDIQHPALGLDRSPP